jgi:hypothetical protein
MIQTYVIVLSIILGIIALLSFFIGVFVAQNGFLTLVAAVLSYILAIVLICNELEIGFLLLFIAWFIMGFGALFDDDIGLGGAIILWIIGGVGVWIYVQGNTQKEQPDVQNLVRTVRDDGTALWCDTTRRCSKIDTCHTCFETRDSVVTRRSICEKCQCRWMHHYKPSQMMTLEEYQREQELDYEEFRYPPFPY